jgi:hypothetical protein
MFCERVKDRLDLAFDNIPDLELIQSDHQGRNAIDQGRQQVPA